MTIKGPIPQQDITFATTYALNLETPKYIKQILTDLKREIDRNTIIVGTSVFLLTIFSSIFLLTIFSSMDRSSREKINKKTLDLTDMLDQITLADI